jgi:hypothetical protein
LPPSPLPWPSLFSGKHRKSAAFFSIQQHFSILTPSAKKKNDLSVLSEFVHLAAFFAARARERPMNSHWASKKCARNAMMIVVVISFGASGVSVWWWRWSIGELLMGYEDGLKIEGLMGVDDGVGIFELEEV